MLRCHFNSSLLKSFQVRLLKQQPCTVQRQAVRFARTRAGTNTTTKPQEADIPTLSGQKILKKPLSESQIISQNKQRVTVNRDELLLEQLNIARPGTATDHRYKHQATIMASLTTEEEKIQSLFVFLAQEALMELEQYPNPDEVTTIDDINEGVTLEEQMEYEMKKSLTNQWNVRTERYKRFEILLTVLEKLHEKSNGGYLVPVEILVALFDASKYIIDAEKLQSQIRYLCGDLIYSLQKFEFDIINESFYVEALMRLGFHKRASDLLLKRESKLREKDQSLRWWGDLIIINQIDMIELVNAEKTVEELTKRFGSEYLDSRVYSSFINVYLEADNFERVSYWVGKLKKAVVKTKGFSTVSFEEPGLESDEKTVLSFLNREDPITKDQYLSIMESLLNSENSRYQSLISQMIDFYLCQPNTSLEKHMELTDLLLKFRFEYKSKIQPVLQSIPARHGLSESLIPLFDQLRELNPEETSQSDLLDEYLVSLSKRSGGFDQITREMKEVMRTGEGKLSSKNYYSLISALIKAKKIEQAFEVLAKLEKAKKDLERNTINMEDSRILVPVTTNHYVPFLRHYGRTSRMDEFNEILVRFKKNVNTFNPVILTQIINSLARSKKYEDLLKFINHIALKDIHLQDPEYLDKPLNQMYSSIWATLSSYFKNTMFYDVKEIPDVRYIFLKMTQQAQIIPTRKDYENIISTFLRSRDFYSAVCVLDLMGSKHKVIPSPKILQEVETSIRRIKDLSSKKERTKEGETKYGELRKRRAKLNTLDPFAGNDSRNKRENLMEDYFEPELELTAKQERIYRLPILRLYNTLTETVGFDEVYMKQVWREFELEGFFDLQKLRDGLKSLESDWEN